MRIVFLLLMSCLLTAAAVPVKVALIGDSITSGVGADDPSKNGYPARLSELMGEGYEVRAFAEPGHGLLRKSKRALLRTDTYHKALEFQADVAVILLGTSDSQTTPNNWQHHADLEGDAAFMIKQLKQANPKVIVHLCSPTPMFPDPDHKESLKPRIKRLVEIKAAYQRVAATTEQVYYHDLARSLRPKETTDGVHPNTAGHQRLAHFFHDILTQEIGTRANCGEISRKRSVWNGFDRHDFQLPKTGASATLVIPHTAAQGQPWIWRARFFGHQPALDMALLDRGYHLAYVDVSNLFGSDAAMQRCDEFYHLLTSKFNLNTSSIMEGMSRGGLMIFNYAARYPDRVSAIYGDNPVCDFKSWPGGQNGQLSKANWKRCLEVYGITAEQAASHPQISDASFASKLGNIPVALVIGTADEVVPPAENGLLLAKHLKGNNNPPKIWTKPGAGHHPHGLDPVEPLLRFLLQADGYGE